MIAILAIDVLLLSTCVCAQTDADRTEDALTKQWEKLNSQIGPDKWETGIALGNLARFYRDQKRYAEAVPFYERALAIAKTQQRENGPLAVAFMREVAAVYRALNRASDADRLEKRAEAASRIPAVGAKKLNPKDGLIYVWIPPGRFGMGCSPGDSECTDPEKPPHPVTISRGFWMGQTTMTGLIQAICEGRRQAAASGKIRRPDPECTRGKRQSSGGGCHAGGSGGILRLGGNAPADGSRMGVGGARRNHRRALWQPR